MDPAAAIWTPHLKPGERVLWQGNMSEQLFRAAAQRRRWVRLGIMAVATIAAFLFSYNFLRDMLHLASGTGSGLASSLSWPLQIAFAVACLAVAIAQPFRLALPRPEAVRFAVTSERVLAANEAGALVEEVRRADIDGLKLGRDLVIHRVKNDAAIAPLIIAHAERLAEAKAAIEHQEPTP